MRKSDMGEGGGTNLINLGDLSRPATVLIERVSDAVGGIAKPWQTRRVAEAEADAEKIRAQAQIEISEIERRALERLVREEGQKQENIESITAKALPLINDQAKPEDIETDWLSHFFDRSRLVSDKEMQTLWANLLAGEANRPGQFSRRTVEIVSTLGKQDAQLFTNLCRFIWIIGTPTVIIDDINHEIFTSFRINFSSLTHLDSIGLISFGTLSGFKRQRFLKNILTFYYNRSILLELPKEDGNNDLPIGNVLLTQAGQELISVCKASPSEEYLNYICSKWCEAGFLPRAPINARAAWTAW